MARSGCIKGLRQLNTVPLDKVKMKYPHFICKNCGNRFAVKSRRQSGVNCSRLCRTQLRIKNRRDTRYDDYIEFDDFDKRPEEVKMRKCLMCGDLFESSHVHNRICPKCKYTNRSSMRYHMDPCGSSF